MRRKVLSLVLALCMVLSLMPMTAFATDLSGGAPTPNATIQTKGILNDNNNTYTVTFDANPDDSTATAILDKITSNNTKVYNSQGGDSTVTCTYTKADTNNNTKATLILTGSSGAPAEKDVYYIGVTPTGQSEEYVKVEVTPKSSDATLSGLTVANDSNNVALSPAFASGTTTYTANVANTVTSVTVTPTVKDTNASVTVASKAVTSGAASDAINLNVGENKIDIVVTAEDGTTIKTYTITITRGDGESSGKGTLTKDNFDYTAPTDLTYDGNAKSATVVAKSGVTTGAITVNYYSGSSAQGSGTAPTDAGTYTVKIDVAANNNYEEATALEVGTFTIAPKALTIKEDGTNVTEKGYDGSTDATVTVAFDGEVVGHELTASDYTVTANFDDANVGENKTVKGAVKLKDTVKNYTLSDGTLPSTLKGTISKAGAVTLTASKLVSIADNAARQTEFALSDMVNYPESPKTFGGTPTFTGTFDGLKIVDSAKVENDKLVLTYKSNFTDAGTDGSDTVTLTSSNAGNYESITVTLTLSYTSKPVVEITGVSAAKNLVYNGNPQNGYTGTLAVSGKEGITDKNVKITYATREGETLEPNSAPTNAGDYKVTFAVDNSKEYESEDVVLNFTIAKAPVTITAKDQTMKVGETAPVLTGADAYTVEGLVNGDKLETAPTLSYASNPDDATEATTIAISISGAAIAAANAANYEITYVAGTLTITASGSGTNPGSGPSGGNGSTTTPTDPTDPTTPTDPNPPSSGVDVSETVTPEINEGTASATVNQETADKLVSDAVDNNSENVTVKVDVPADADVNEVKADIPASAVADLASKTDANLTVETPVANVTLPNETLAQLGGASGNVTVTAAVNEDNSVKVEVQSNGSTVGSLNGGMKVDLPVSQPTAGTVAVLVDENGNETILPKSAVDGSEMAVLLETGSATIKFVDNAQSFADTDSHWAKNSIAFVSSRNLFQGMENNNFKADVPMNRAMLVTVLHRLESTPAAAGSSFDDVPSDSYYATAAAWAAGKGIVTGDASGFSGDRNVTREEMAVMLYRYVQTINGNKGTLGSFSNMGGASDVSGWATEAMRWAVGSGIISGDNSGNLNPGSTATRGEVSQMLMNFVKLITK